MKTKTTTDDRMFQRVAERLRREGIEITRKDFLEAASIIRRKTDDYYDAMASEGHLPGNGPESVEIMAVIRFWRAP